jgi:glycosyltransferase involved in cell wall biosynthesis
MTPAVSVAIAAYNHARYLGETLESALGQTFGDLEIIVVDDGSTDATGQLAQSYLTDPRVRYHRIAHAGASAAKNAAVQLGTAPLVALLDADDVWLPDKLRRQLALLEKDPELGVVYARRLEMDENGRQRSYEQPPLFRGRIVADLFTDNPVCYSSALVRREVFDAVGFFDTQLTAAEDYDFWLRAALKYRFDYVDEPLIKYRRGPASTGRDEARLLQALAVMNNFVERAEAAGAIPESTRRRAFAETYFHLSLARRLRSRLGAISLNLRALALAPSYLAAWKGLAALALPEAGRRSLRRLANRSAHRDAGSSAAPVRHSAKSELSS